MNTIEFRFEEFPKEPNDPRSEPNWSCTCDYAEQHLVLRLRERGAIEYEWKPAGETGKAARLRIGSSKDPLGAELVKKHKVDKTSPAHAIAWAKEYLKARHIEHEAGIGRASTVEKRQAKEEYRVTHRDGIYLYRKLVMPTRSENRQKALNRCFAALEAMDMDPRVKIDLDEPLDLLSDAWVQETLRARKKLTLTLPGWYVAQLHEHQQKRCGGLLPPNKNGKGAAEMLRIYSSVTKWVGLEAVNEQTGHALFPARKNPLNWEWIPEKDDVLRKALSLDYLDVLLEERFDAEGNPIGCFLDQADPTGVLKDTVLVARYSGHRIGSVLPIRGHDWITTATRIKDVLRRCSDAQLKKLADEAQVFADAGGVLYFRKEFDKENLDRPLPQHAVVVEIMNRRVAGLRSPKHPLFPSPKKASEPMGYNAFARRLVRAEKLAKAAGFGEHMPVRKRSEKEFEDDREGIHGARVLRKNELMDLGWDSWIANMIGGWVVAEKSEVADRKYRRGAAEKLVRCARGERFVDEATERRIREAEARAERLEAELAELRRLLVEGAKAA